MRLPPPRSPAFEAFVAPARARPQLWRLVLGFGVVALLWAAVTVALLRLAPEAVAAPAERVVLVAYLYGFAGMILGLWVAARLLQRRSFAGLIGPDGFSPGDFLFGVVAMAAIGVASGVVWLALAAPTQAQPVAAWAAWLPLALLALLVQTAAEELVFRGYLMQGLAARFRSWLVWWLVPALLFGLLHWSPQVYGANAWLAVLSATLIGLALADVTARTGGLSLAMGLHFANNVAAVLILAPPSELSWLSLFAVDVDPADPAAMRRLILADLATTLAAYALWLGFGGRWRRLHPGGRGSI